MRMEKLLVWNLYYLMMQRLQRFWIFVVGKGVTLFTLLETGKGSDGMSDVIYPFDVTVKSSEFLPQGGIGGCYSETKPKTEPVH